MLIKRTTLAEVEVFARSMAMLRKLNHRSGTKPMLKQQTLALAFLSLLMPPIYAKQAISESLLDCAALFTMSTRAFPERQTAKTAALKNAANLLTAKAHERAATEGRSNIKQYVAKLLRKKQNKWDARGVGFIFSDEFGEWASYCRSLSKHLGLNIKPVRNE